MDNDQKKIVNDRLRILEIVEEGSKSEYWKILKGELQKIEKRYELFIQRLDNKTLEQEELKQRNEAVFQLKFIRWMLNINERIIADQKTFFDKLKAVTEHMYERMRSFVK